MIKLAFNNGTFPDNGKIAKIVPIYKSGKKKPTNFRPISILTCFSKIFKKLKKYKKQFKFFENTKVLNPH